MNKLENLEADADSKRSIQARAAYIRWRMADLPVVYTELMPFTYCAATLLTAEKCIRAQVDEDLKHLASPWRRVGPAPALLNYEGMSAQEKLNFALEMDVPVGLADAPKPGRWNDPEVVAAFEAAKASPEYQAAIAYGQACDAAHAVNAALREAQQTGDQSIVDKVNADWEAANAKLDELKAAYPKLKNSFNLPLSMYGQPNNWRE
jgi:hypothetical protein